MINETVRSHYKIRNNILQAPHDLAKHQTSAGKEGLLSKGKKTRQRIVEEAATLFNQRGFEGSSMAALMEATGLEKGGIYRHFTNKQELAAEAFDYAWSGALDARLQGLDTIANSVDGL